MIDVIIYTDPEDMYASEKCLAEGKLRTTTDIKKALVELGFEDIGLISMRSKMHHEKEYNKVIGKTKGDTS